MPTHEVAEAFDQISVVYDSTRDPLDPATLYAIAARLHAKGIRTVLEVGVGTGRIAAPLVGHGFDVTGLDASLGMLEVAHSKGLTRLVRGNAYRMPFGDLAFDTTLFVHVLHLLDHAALALREAVRVGRQGATALVHPAVTGPTDPLDSSEHEPRRLVYGYLARAGYRVPGPAGGPRTRERALLGEFPPDDLTIIGDRMVTEPLAKRVDMLARRGSRHTLEVPTDVLERAVAAARAEIGDRTITYRRVEALATWSTAPAELTPGP